MSKNKKKNEVEEKENNNKSIVAGFGDIESYEFALRTAKLLAQSSLVPEEYQGNIPNCVIAINMANRMKADVLMVMQNLYIVYGKPGWSAQFLISTFNTSGRFSAIRYNWVGEKGKNSWGCQAYATEKETGEELHGATVTIQLAKDEGWYDKKGSKWKTMPEQMLMYRAAAWFIRTYAPEIAMGMYTEDEIIDITPEQNEKTHDLNAVEEIKEKANSEEFDISDEELNKEEEASEPESDPAEKKEDKDQPEEPKLKKQESNDQTSMSDKPGFAL
ncbi:MAG: hypothetical protein BHK79_02755 [Halanaerobium sp. MDAL1]|nr:MAG: hypothetical protein BHK79_02755 [Halanaerobium sp. MDAL1]